MKQHFLSILLVFTGLLSSVSLPALTREERMSVRNELRIGWGDMLYERAMYHNSNSTNRYRYTGHIFAEYQYYLRPWFSIGVQADYEQVWWDVIREGIQPLPTPGKDHFFYNVCLMPAVCFTYCHHPHLNLYSELMLGVGVNGGTETDMYGRTLAWTPAWGFTLLGIKAGGKHCFATVEIGALNAVAGRNFIYMLGSRIFSASIGCNF